ncbi:family 16 glycosylhydrolase [Bacteroides sp.]|uniref:family 16 glycosylhydrolase n=1 Tax=Bacteroides sp. TaxID=29523 RepID=UPI00261FF3B8|nr:family 16 glycosylhydrolase [Bacteroides sp.]
MKEYYLLLIFLFSLMACGSNDDKDPRSESVTIKCSPEKVEATAQAGQYVVNVACSGKEWTAFASDDCSAWIKVSVTGSSSSQGTATITVSAHTGTTSREGTVVIKSGITRVSVPVTQAAPLSVSKTELYSNSVGEAFSLSVITSGEWNVKSNDNWITAEKIDGKIVVTTLANDVKTSRTGSVEVVSGAEKVTVTVIQESAEDRDIHTPEGYRLIWHDEFDEGTTLGSDWTHEVQGPGWVNNELQSYVNGSAGGKRVTELMDGKLNINCFKGTDGKIYSGRVYAKVNEGWLYGYFEARILLPKGKGTWPAFWMMPVNNNFSTNPWPGCGEIDIMEEVGADPNVVSSSIHCAAYNHTINTQKTAARNIGTAESEYHIYACEWTTDYLKFFVDGIELMAFKNEGTGKNVWPFTYNFYPILNLAWGGDWGGYKGVDENALPITMKVDYVRVFQKK